MKYYTMASELKDSMQCHNYKHQSVQVFAGIEELPNYWSVLYNEHWKEQQLSEYDLILPVHKCSLGRVLYLHWEDFSPSLAYQTLLKQSSS